MIPVRCACGRNYQARPEHAGKSIRCACGRHVPIPGRTSRWRYPLPLPPRIGRAITLLGWGWAAVVVTAILVLWGLGDRWWPATLLLYGPRWPLLLPAPVLLLAALLVQPRLAIPVVAGAGLGLVFLMGYRTGWRPGGSFGGPATLRIVTFNMQGGQNALAPDVPLALSEYTPDLALIQECAPAVDALRGLGSDWHFRRDGSLCLLSRMPVDSVRVHESIQTREDGMTGLAVVYFLPLQGRPAAVANVHLETPRRGLEGIRYRGQSGSLSRNILLRDAGSQRVSRWLTAQAADLVVGGDFNLPVESAIFRRHWGGCPSAFSTRGRGLGYTRILPNWSARIDHVLTCGGRWEAVNAFVGGDAGSDHLPLVVDLRER